MVRQLLVERIELRLSNADDAVRLAVCGKVVFDLRQAPQPHRIRRHQLVTGLVDEEAQRQVAERQSKVGPVQRTVRVVY